MSFSEPQKRAVEKQVEMMYELLETDEQKRRLYFMLDTILQYGAVEATWVMYNKIEELRKSEK